MLTDIRGEAGHSMGTTEEPDWAEGKWQWRHLCGEKRKTFSASVKGEKQKEKEGSSKCSDGSKTVGRQC